MTKQTTFPFPFFGVNIGNVKLELRGLLVQLYDFAVV